MPAIWIVSEDPSRRDTLAVVLDALGEIHAHPPERARVAGMPAAELLVLAPLPETERGLPRLERLLEFARTTQPERREPPPILYVEPEGGEPSGSLARRLIDDRPIAISYWPPDPDQIFAEASALLAARSGPASLRARARRAWVNEHVELFYAGLELPALRQAIDPRNAFRPVLLVGEPGTGRALLARYIHELAEPPRQEQLVLPGSGLPGGRVCERLFELSHGRRVSAYLDALDRLAPPVQDELAHALSAGGLLGLETIRWIASAERPLRMTQALRLVDWLRVELPALRVRADLGELAQGLAQSFARRAGREVQLSDDALDALRRYAWPRNLWELRQVIENSVAGCRQAVLQRDDLVFAAALAAPAGSAELGTPPPNTSEAPAEPPAPAEAPASAEQPVGTDSAGSLGLADIALPLAQEIRKPMLAIRTYASALDRGGDDAGLRRELGALVEADLARVDGALGRLEQFSAFGPPVRRAVDVAALIGSELERRRVEISEHKLVILQELDREAPPVMADEAQLVFAFGSLLDRALQMIPTGGDLYVGTFHHPPDGHEPAHLRVLIRFHSPEDVLVPPAGVPGPAMPFEVVLARALIERIRGHFAVDASGAQDNLILIDLPL